MFGFSKNDRANIDEQEEKLYRMLAKYYLNLSDTEIDTMLSKKTLIEVSYEQD